MLNVSRGERVTRALQLFYLRAEFFDLFELACFYEVHELDPCQKLDRLALYISGLALKSLQSSPHEVQRNCAVFTAIETQCDLFRSTLKNPT